MRFFKRLANFCRNPYAKGAHMLNFVFCEKVTDDKTYIKLDYLFHLHKRLNLKNPKTFNEKLQWMKLYYREPIMTKMVDKAESKMVVCDIMGSDEYIIPTLGVYDNFDDIDFDALPDAFVIKTTHDSGGVVVVPDKTKLDIEAAKAKINHSLKHNFYMLHREWPYKDVKPRIIVEKFMVDESGTELKDYKFFCFNGVPKLLLIITDRANNAYKDYYDIDFNHLDVKNADNPAPQKISRPKGFDKMVEIAAKLSQGLPHVRIDLYNINGKIYFGEFTFFHMAGLKPYTPEWDRKIGDMLTLPDKNKPGVK